MSDSEAPAHRRHPWLGSWRGLLLWGLLLCPVLATARIEVTDDLGHAVHLDEPADRIVSLAPHATELLFAAGAGERVVGTVQYSDYPPAARSIPRVGGYDAVDLERIVALQPDLVITWHSGNGPGLAARLRELGLTVYVSEPRRLSDIPHALTAFGRLAGTAAVAAAAAARFRNRTAALAERYAHRPPVRVFYQIWDEPLLSVNGDHLISEIMRLCGGRNVFADLRTLVPRLSVEAVLAANPEAIVASGKGVSRPEWLDRWHAWPSLTAVRRGNLFHVPPDLIQRHSPRVLDGAERLCGQLQIARQRRGSGR
jgi:iron complex transport system substrate-binding protein